jgi:hypothetical protein
VGIYLNFMGIIIIKLRTLAEEKQMLETIFPKPQSHRSITSSYNKSQTIKESRIKGRVVQLGMTQGRNPRESPMRDCDQPELHSHSYPKLELVDALQLP